MTEEQRLLKIYGTMSPIYDGGRSLYPFVRHEMSEHGSVSSRTVYLPICKCPATYHKLSGGCHWCNPEMICKRIREQEAIRKEQSISYVGTGSPLNGRVYTEVKG